MKNNIIMKFGGTSLANPENIRLVKEIILSTPNVKAVIVSAPGISDKFPIKVTDALLDAHIDRKNYEKHMNYVRAVFENIVSGLGIYFELSFEFEKIKNEYKINKSRSYLVSRGEYLSAKIMAKYLDFEFIDSVNLIKFAKNGKILNKTYKIIQNKLKNKQNIIIPGFYGSSRLGKVKIMCRGGSDITGSIVANSLENTVYQNYTDVDGVFDSVPGLCEEPKVIKKISYENMQFLSFYGCGVLHYKCPGIFSKGKTVIKNTFNRKSAGTTILSKKFCENNSAITLTYGYQLVFNEKNKKVHRLLKKLKHEKLYSLNRMGDEFYAIRLTTHDYDEKVFEKIKRLVWDYDKIVIYGLIGDVNRQLFKIKKEHTNCILCFSDNGKTNMVYKLD